MSTSCSAAMSSGSAWDLDARVPSFSNGGPSGAVGGGSWSRGTECAPDDGPGAGGCVGGKGGGAYCAGGTGDWGTANDNPPGPDTGIS